MHPTAFWPRTGVWQVEERDGVPVTAVVQRDDFRVVVDLIRGRIEELQVDGHRFLAGMDLPQVQWSRDGISRRPREAVAGGWA